MSTVDWIIFGFGVFVVSLLSAGLFITFRYFKTARPSAGDGAGELRGDPIRAESPGRRLRDSSAPPL